VLLRRSDECNLEQFEASRHKREFERKVLVVRTDVACLTSIRTEYHVFRMDGKDLNFIVLHSAQNLLEAYNQSVDSKYNSIPKKQHYIEVILSTRIQPITN
jgi:hypothetical protein